MKNCAGNRAAGIIDQKHHGNSGPNAKLLYAMWAATPEKTVSRVAACSAGSLWLFYYPLGYPMHYALAMFI
jgi:hypothetical protein